MTSNETSRKPIKPKPRCDICNGKFGLIRHRFAHMQFCSKRCLEQYLAKSKQRPPSLKQWLDFFSYLGFGVGSVIRRSI
jgi:hypothetical protein